LSFIQAGGARHLRLVILAASAIHNETQYRTVNSFLTVRSGIERHFKNLFYYNTDGQVLAASDPVLVGQVVVRQPFLGELAGERYTAGALLRIGQQERRSSSPSRCTAREPGWSACWPPGWT